jgi:WD40 repeat protein
VWDAVAGTEIMTLRGHSNMVLDGAYSPEGEHIISGGRDRTIKIWDALTGTEKLTLHGHKRHVFSVAFSPDGTRIISGAAGGTIKIWDAETGSELMTFRTGTYNAAFSPDGKKIAAGTGGASDPTITVWESAAPADGYEARRIGVSARRVVDRLHGECQLYSKVIDKLKSDKTLEDPVRNVALQIANVRQWEDEEKGEELISDEK